MEEKKDLEVLTKRRLNTPRESATDKGALRVRWSKQSQHLTDYVQHVQVVPKRL